MINLLADFIKTPPLWLKEQFGIQQFILPKTIIPEKYTLPTSKNLRLGHQLEYVFGDIIKTADQYEIIAQNIYVEER